MILDAFEMVDADPQFVSIVDKGANHRVFSILKMDGAQADADDMPDTFTEEQLAFYDETHARAFEVPSEEEMERTVIQQLSIKRRLIDKMMDGLRGLGIGADAKGSHDMTDINKEVRKGFGEGPGVGFTSVDAALADLHITPQVFDVFGMTQRVLFNILNDEKVEDKSAAMDTELDSMKRHVLGLMKELPKTAMEKAERRLAALQMVSAMADEEVKIVQKLFGSGAVLKVESKEEGEKDMNLDELKVSIDEIGKKFVDGQAALEQRLAKLEQPPKTAEQIAAEQKVEDERKAAESAAATTAAEAEQKAKADKEAAEKAQGDKLDSIASVLKELSEKVETGLKDQGERIGKIENLGLVRKGSTTDTGLDNGRMQSAKKSVYAGTDIFGWDVMREELKRRRAAS
jgi:hypothetical protein